MKQKLLVFLFALSLFSLGFGQATVSGFVKDLEGNPIADYDVYAIAEENQASLSFGTTDANGAYSIYVATNGTFYTVGTADCTDQPVITVVVKIVSEDLTADDLLICSVAVEDDFVLSGIVTDGASPLADITVSISANGALVGTVVSDENGLFDSTFVGGSTAGVNIDYTVMAVDCNSDEISDMGSNDNGATDSYFSTLIICDPTTITSISQTIDGDVIVNGDGVVVVSTISGVIVKNQKVGGFSKIDTSDLPNGQFVIKFITESKSTSFLYFK